MQTPDWDNIGKAVCDALWPDKGYHAERMGTSGDAGIHAGSVEKYWCKEGRQRIECIFTPYNNPEQEVNNE